MNSIHDFYTNLDLLELIIFWGIILVVLLTIILIIIIVNKKQKNKNDITQQYTQFEEELPIIENSIKEEKKENYIEEANETIFSINEKNNLLEEMAPIIETAEDNVETNEELQEEMSQNKYKTTFEMPSAPYQRNVLREMSLSQTSPIGINRKDDYVRPQELFELYPKQESKESNFEKEIEIPTTNEKEKLIVEEITEEPETDSYEIERTQYEIEQEENAIISYKELMEKKDSIQTIDEEDAIISIEELLNKTNQKEEPKEEPKLYNISENEENDSFINELKQFRKDL